MPAPRLLAVSDLHVRYPENRAIVEGLRPGDDGDWLIVAGDVAERVDDVRRHPGPAARAVRQVVWVPGNHELWTPPTDPVHAARRASATAHLVRMCRAARRASPRRTRTRSGPGAGGPVVVAPLFLLYDYSFRARRHRDRGGGRWPRPTGPGWSAPTSTCSHPDPYPDRDAWCAARVA